MKPNAFLFCRCYAEELANKTIEEIREIYSSYPNPHCTPYNTRGNHDQFGSVAYELRGGEERCDRWFYEFDHGYQSMSSEVSFLYFIGIFRCSTSPLHPLLRQTFFPSSYLPLF